MNAAAKKKSDEETAVVPSAVAHPLLARPIPHAYALLQDPARPGRFFAVHLTDLIAKGIEFLEPSARSEPATYGLGRMRAAMEDRHRRKTWVTK